MSSPSLTNAIHLAQSLNAAKRASLTAALHITTLESRVRWLSALILVFVGFSDGTEIAVAVLLYSGSLIKRGLATPFADPERKRLSELDDLDAALSQAVARGESEESEARWAELSGRLALAHGAAFEEPPHTDAARHLGATLAANDRLERLNAAISAREAQIARLRRLWIPCMVAVPLVGGLVFLLARSYGGVWVMFFAALWTVLLLVGVAAGIPAHSSDLRKQLSSYQPQVAALRALLAEANGSTGAALMARWLTLRAQQEDELPLLSLVSEAAAPGASPPAGVVT